MGVPAPVGLIGVGLLGLALAERFRAGGFAVTGFDRDPERRRLLGELGGQPVDAATEVARACERVVLSLPDTPVVEAVLAEIGPGLRPGQVIVDTTTGDPERTAALGARLHARGVHYLDATVVGSSEQARAGEVVVLVGGDRPAFDACADLFGCFARCARHVGPWGSGATLKLVVNLVLGLNRAVLAEGLALARASGLDPHETLDVLRDTAAYSRAMDAKGPKMVTRDFTPQARLSQHLKDVRLILAQARRAGAKAPLSELHRQLLEAVEAAGFGGEDNAAVLRAYD